MPRSLLAADRATEYTADLLALERRSLSLQARDVLRLREAFAEFVRQGLASLPAAGGLNQAVISSLLRDLAGNLDALARSLQQTIRGGIDAQENVANRILDAYMRHFTGSGEAIGHVSLDVGTFDIAVDYSARLVAASQGGLVARMQRDLDTAIRLEALGMGTGRPEATTGRILQAIRGVRRHQWEAERIYRTEALRMQSMVLDQGILRLNRAGVATRKRWVWSHIERLEHAQIDGQIVAASGKFRVPLRDGGVTLMRFPRDPAAPPSATINCGCQIVPVPGAAIAQARRLGVPLT